MKIPTRGCRVTAKVFLPSQFPLEVEAVWYPAEPDIGIMSPYCEIEGFNMLALLENETGATCLVPFWRELTKAEHDYVLEQIPLPEPDPEE